jgi:hypothetical protein
MARFCSRSFGLVLVVIALPAGTRPCAAQTAFVRHAPTLNGSVEGSVQQMTAENVTLNGNASITGDLLVPGTPSLRLNGGPVFGGTTAGAGSATPSNYQVTLNGGSHLGRLRTRTDPVSLPAVTAPSQPAGSRSVSVNNSSQSPGDFATIRNLTLNGNVGPVAVPPGTYGGLIANGNSGFILGLSGAGTPAVYNFQNLTLNGNSVLEVVGPVVVTLNGGFSINGSMGAPGHSEWLRLRLAGGGLTLNGNVSLYGYVEAPAGTVTLNGSSRLVGGIASDGLIVNGNSLLRLVAVSVPKRPPTVTLLSPLGGTIFPSGTAIKLIATAGDLDGTVTRVEFYDGNAKIGDGSAILSASYELVLPGGLPPGAHVLVARATDNLGAAVSSSPVSIMVNPPQNRMPEVVLTAPLGQSTHAAGASLGLSATASDADGVIVKVEFYIDGELIGTLTAPSEFPSSYAIFCPAPGVAGSHILKARAYDNTGSFQDSVPVSITVVASLPYAADFEGAKRYRLGSLQGQQGWTVTQGAAEVVSSTAFQGTQSVELKPGPVGAVARQTFAGSAGDGPTFVDLFVRPVAGLNPEEGSAFDLGGATVAFVRDGTAGRMQALQWDAFGAPSWKPAGSPVALDGGGGATRWIRLTARLSYATGAWDIYVDGQLAWADLGFDYMKPAPLALTALSVQGGAPQASYFDFLYAGLDNPLFADADRDGMDDAWEIDNGLDPAVDDRDGDKDGDGLVNVREYQLGTRADRADTDGDGLPDAWEVQRHLDPLKAAEPDADTDGDGVSDLEEYAAGINPLAADTDGDGLPDGWEIAHGFNPSANDSIADIDGDGWSNLEEYRRGSDPHDFFNGVLPRTETLNDGGPGAEEELSMVVRKADGTPWPNAPAVFHITSGTRRISAVRNGPAYGSTVSVRADAQGVARVYLEPYQP